MKRKSFHYFALMMLFAIGTQNCNNKNESTITQNNTTNAKNNNSINTSTFAVNVDNESDCLFYLKGKCFYGGNVRLKFTDEGYAEVYDKRSNNLVFLGSVDIGERYGSASRKLKIKDMSGSGSLCLVLGNDGKLMDETDFTIYKP